MKIKLNREKQVETILAICVGLVVVWFFTGRDNTIFLTLSVLIGAIGLFSKSLTSIIANGWMKIGELMGAVTGKIILSLVFFLFLLPLAFLSRLFSKAKDGLHLKKSDGSYYFQRNHKYTPKDLENTW